MNKRKYISFKNKLFFTFLLFSVIPVIIIYISLISIGTEIFKRRAINQLETTQKLIAYWINDWIDHAKKELVLTVILIEKDFKNFKNTDNINSEISKTTLINIQEHLRYHDNISLINPETGVIFLSSNENLIGRIPFKDDFFVKSKKSVFISSIVYSVGREEPIINISAPILNKDNKLLAIICTELDMKELNKIIKNENESVESGTSFLVDLYGFYITLKPGSHNIPLSTLAEGESVKEVLKKKDGYLIYTDKKDNKILSLYRWIQDINIGIITERKLKDINMPITIISVIILILIFTLIGISILIAAFFSSVYIKPINAINSVATTLTSGDLSARVVIDSGKRDEITELASAFNEMADKIRDSYKTLEKKVEEKTKEFLNEKIIAEKASKAKTEFLSNMSHEIRNPLNSLMGFTGLLINTDLNKEQEEMVKFIKKSGDHLLIIINDILNLSKIEAGKKEIVYENINIRKLIEEIINVNSNNAKQKNLELSYFIDPEVPEIIKTDSTLLKEIIFNLLSNSFKFTEKGEVNLKVKKTDNKIEYHVTDTGIGIPSDMLSYIFENFTQIDSSYTKKQQGTGLGLAIVKKLTELLNGKIDVKSEVGIGTTFTVVIPLIDLEINNDSKDASDKSNIDKLFLKNIKVLVAEDDAVNQMFIGYVLKKNNIVFDSAKNGKEVIEKITNNKYDIIFMDIQMPYINGYDCAKKIRELGINTAIIAMTGYSLKEEIDLIFKSGMNDYLSKPASEIDIINKIAGIIKEK